MMNSSEVRIEAQAREVRLLWVVDENVVVEVMRFDRRRRSVPSRVQRIGVRACAAACWVLANRTSERVIVRRAARRTNASFCVNGLIRNLAMLLFLYENRAQSISVDNTKALVI